jgi:exosortase
MIVVLAGTIVFVLGWPHLRAIWFPVAFLIFMIPLPAILFDRLAVSLQLVASRLSEQMLQAARVPVLRDGNVLTLANSVLEVNDACSGIRSVMALVAVVTVAGYLFEPSLWRRAAVALLAAPLAVALNAVRVALTGIAATRFGPDAAKGAVHAAAGWIVFVMALAAIGVVHCAIRTKQATFTAGESAGLEVV